MTAFYTGAAEAANHLPATCRQQAHLPVNPVQATTLPRIPHIEYLGDADKLLVYCPTINGT
jgi:hypothetical protein